MHVCDVPEKFLQFNSWEGKLMYIDKSLKRIDQKSTESSETILKHLADIDSRLQKIEKTVSSGMRLAEESNSQRKNDAEAQKINLNTKFSEILSILVNK
ncbi:hypothetical protein SteCoe_33250 [Stentor coeruleus]|uniref:Uncharacterized protein n=1 Tax=Stentor coeruleus TaxID=5963 RepID=A0A1R2AX47_9CILI|nr:hypothetical protein SteCoe_33250 [Stentor coeruleus]